MTATLTIIYWREIPAQVIARDGERSHKVVLDPRFQVAIDQAAMKAGLNDFDDYVGEWRRVSEPCGDDLEAEAVARATRLEADLDKKALSRLAAAGGLQPGGEPPDPASRENA